MSGYGGEQFRVVGISSYVNLEVIREGNQESEMIEVAVSCGRAKVPSILTSR